MQRFIDPFLTQPDTIVLKNLLQDIDDGENHDSNQIAVTLLDALNDEKSDDFQPTVFTGWDLKGSSPQRKSNGPRLTPTLSDENTDLSRSTVLTDHSLEDSSTHIVNAKNSPLPQILYRSLLQPYIEWASKVVRRPTDVVFLTHIILYLSTSVPSAIYLYYGFTWPHGICHWLMQTYYCGSFTLMLHNHIHNNGVLAPKYAWLDKTFPYILEPLMGHTWDSYYYHHVKHHHVESNGPDDLSSTLRYQRDELKDFLIYVVRFVALIWVELPLYFLRKGKQSLAIRCIISELASYLTTYLLAKYNLRATLFVFILPLLQMRFGMMIGNWGQHAFVDEIEPDSDFRSSITLIDVPVSNPLSIGLAIPTLSNPPKTYRE